MHASEGCVRQPQIRDVGFTRRNIRRAKHALRALRRGNRPHPRQPVLDALPKGGAGAEIGVWKGEFSRQLLSSMVLSRLLLVDPFRFRGEMPGRWYGGLQAQSQRGMDRIHQQVVDELSHRPEVEILRATSIEAAAEIEDGSLD